jgi:sRNA-binding protein
MSNRHDPQQRRQDHNEVIQILSELYPKTFFANPQQRRPLKPTIVDDLEKEKANEPNLAWYDLRAAVEWYMSHFGYEYACTTGAKRINLEGKEVGKVTASEAREAAGRIAFIKEQRRNDAVRTAQALHGKGGMTDDQMSKITAPPIKTNSNEIEPRLESAIGALTEARGLLVLNNIILRTALLKAAISVATASLAEIVSQLEQEQR